MSSARGLALLSLLPFTTTTTTSSGWCGSSRRRSRGNNIESASRSRRSSFCRNIPLKLERASAGFCGLNKKHHRAAASGRGGALGGSGGSRGGTSFCWSGRKTMFPNRRRDNLDENKSNWTSWELFGNGEKHNTVRRLNEAKAMSSTDEEISNYLPGFKDCPRNLKVAYQGEPGAYSEAAALTAYPDAERSRAECLKKRTRRPSRKSPTARFYRSKTL